MTAVSAVADIEIEMQAMVETLRAGRIDEAEAMFQRLARLDARVADMLLFPVLFMIQRHQPLDALRFVDAQPAGRCPELRALCLKVLGDPTWHGEAMALVESPDPGIAHAMRELLELPPRP